jgi:hypothetical protein
VGGAFLGLVFGLADEAVSASLSLLSRQRNKGAAETPNATAYTDAATGATADQWPLERPAWRVAQSLEPSVGSIVSSGDPSLQTSRDRRLERRRQKGRERLARIREVLRSREPVPHLARLVEEERQAWLLQLLKHDRDPEKLCKLYAWQNVHLLNKLCAGPRRRQRREIRAMPLEKLREWNSALERQYALTLEYAMRMSNSEHFAIGLRHFLQANIVIQSICIPILALSFVSYEFAPGVYQVLQFPCILAALLEMGMLLQLFTINDWNRTGRAGARAELEKKQRTASRELAGWLDSRFSISGGTQDPSV